MFEDTQKAIRQVVDRAGPATVGIGSRWSRGSGLVVADDRVLTNAHNAPGGEVGVVFADGRQTSGQVAAADVETELAVVQVDTGSITPVEHADGPPGMGQAVIAVSNPGGRGVHATLGFVSATGRSFRGPRGTRVDGAIEHTAPMVRGSSGGPLLETDGRLVGVNTHRLDGGLYLAMPTDDDLRAAVDRLARGEVPTRTRLGIAVAPAGTAKRLRAAVGLDERDGLLVREVADEGPAARADIRRGDLIVGAAENAIASVDDLHAVLAEHDRDDRLLVTVIRGSEEIEVAIGFGSVAQEGRA